LYKYYIINFRKVIKNYILGRFDMTDFRNNGSSKSGSKRNNLTEEERSRGGKHSNEGNKGKK
jgi:hypothetical protein